MSEFLPYVYGFVAGGACVGGWWWWINNRAKARAAAAVLEAKARGDLQTIENLAKRL